ncbi:MAG: hypothetical protein PHQ69_09940 [Bacteroidales bacterium]|nr:hypothetical protein [Bacteroidales bacterium]
MKIKTIRFSSNRATVDYDLPNWVDPSVFEEAVNQNLSDLRMTYDELEVKSIPEPLIEGNNRWLSLGIIIVATAIGIAIFALC